MEVSKEFLMEKVKRIEEIKKQMYELQDALLDIMADIHCFCLKDKIMEITKD